MAFAIIINDKKTKVQRMVGRVWAVTRDEAKNMAGLFHPCEEGQELELRAE